MCMLFFFVLPIVIWVRFIGISQHAILCFVVLISIRIGQNHAVFFVAVPISDKAVPSGKPINISLEIRILKQQPQEG